MQFASLLYQYHDAFQTNTPHGFCPVICALWTRSADVEHRRPGKCSCNAPTAVMPHGDLVLADTVVARNARIMKHQFGWIGNRPNFYRLSTSWRHSRFPMKSDSWSGITKSSFTIFFSVRIQHLERLWVKSQNPGRRYRHDRDSAYP